MKYIIIIFLFFSCAVSEKTYKKVATDINVTSEKKAVLAPFVSIYFPVHAQWIQGPDVIKTDTLDNYIYSVDTITGIRIDTLTRTITKTISRVDTVKAEDYSKLLIVRRELETAQGNEHIARVDQKEAENKLQDARGNNKNLWLIIIGLGLALATSIYLHFKR